MPGSNTCNDGASPVPPNDPEQQVTLREWREGAVTDEPRRPARKPAPPGVPAGPTKPRYIQERLF